jgi:hypothetical protein
MLEAIMNSNESVAHALHCQLPMIKTYPEITAAEERAAMVGRGEKLSQLKIETSQCFMMFRVAMMSVLKTETNFLWVSLDTPTWCMTQPPLDTTKNARRTRKINSLVHLSVITTAY